MTGRSTTALIKRAQMLAAKGDYSMIELAEALSELEGHAEAARRRSPRPSTSLSTSRS